MQNRVFFPQAAFDQWLVEGAIDLAGNELTILAASAVAAEKLSESDAQAELSEVSARRTDGLSGPEIERLRKARTRAEAKLRAARSFRGKSI